MRTRALVVAAIAAASLAACGSGSSSQQPSSSLPAAFDQPCSAAKPAAKKLPPLPHDFPTPDGVTYTSGSKAGPSTIVYGYYAADLTAAHNGWDDAFKGAGYTITAEEQDPADAEVNFSSDADNVTGQVRLQESCKGRSLVTVTIRPD